MPNNQEKTIEYVIKKADPAIYGKSGVIVETVINGKFFTSQKRAENWCNLTGKKFGFTNVVIINN